MVEVRVQSLGLDRTSNTPLVILKEVGADRVLPIWIGPGEASAIAMQLGGMSFSRPLTHDLLVSVMSGLGGDLRRVLITKVESSTYYAELIIVRGDQTFSVDARPSDSIALALRADATIMADEALLEPASIVEGWEQVSDHHCSFGAADGTSCPPKDDQTLEQRLRNMRPEDFGRFET